MSERLYYFAPNLNGSDAPNEEDQGRTECPKEMANLVSSLCDDGRHMPVLDIDLPCRLVPSSTLGHFHLYIDVPMEQEPYLRLVDALAEAGIVQKFYAEAARLRGATFVRPPWVTKPPRVLIDRSREAIPREGESA